MEERLAIVTHSLDDLRKKISSYLKKVSAIEGLFRGSINETVRSEVKVENERDISAIAQKWVNGAIVEWRYYHNHNNNLKRIPLPTYPFKEGKHWVSLLKKDLNDLNYTQHKIINEHLEKPEADNNHLNNNHLNIEAHIQQNLINIASSIFELSEDVIKVDKNLSEYGFNSLLAMKMINRIQDVYGKKIPVKSLFKYSTIKSISKYMVREKILEGKNISELKGKELTVIEKTKPGKIIEEINYKDSAEETSFDKRFHEILICGLYEGKITPEQALKIEEEIIMQS